MKLSIETPDKSFYKDEVEMVILPTPDGEIGVLNSHMLMVVALDTATMKIKTGPDWRTAVISGGFAHIKGSEVVVLTDTAEWPEDIDRERALEDKAKAEEEVRARKSEIEYILAMAALKRAVLRISMAKGGGA